MRIKKVSLNSIENYNCVNTEMEYEYYLYNKNQCSDRIKYLITLKYVYNNLSTDKQKEVISFIFSKKRSQQECSYILNINESSVTRRKQCFIKNCEKILFFIDTFYRFILSDSESIDTDFEKILLAHKNHRIFLTKKQKNQLLFFSNLLDKDNKMQIFNDYYIFDKKMDELAIENNVHICNISRNLKKRSRMVLEIINIYNYTLYYLEKGININEIFN